MRGIDAGVSQNFGRKSEKAESFGFMRGEQKITPDLLWRKDIPCNFGSKCRLRKSKLNKLKPQKLTLILTFVDEGKTINSCSSIFVWEKIARKDTGFYFAKNYA